MAIYSTTLGTKLVLGSCEGVHMQNFEKQVFHMAEENIKTLLI